jgi:hypothetical protein
MMYAPTETMSDKCLTGRLSRSQFRFSDGLSGLRDLKNSITLAQCQRFSSLLARYRLFQLQFKFSSNEDDV